MAETKTVKLHNRSEKPDNIVLKEHKVAQDCAKLEEQFPKFMRGYFAYLRSNVLPMTRLSYLRDVRFFCQYLIEHTGLTDADEIRTEWRETGGRKQQRVYVMASETSPRDFPDANSSQ